jgi:hypothetical protein
MFFLRDQNRERKAEAKAKLEELVAFKAQHEIKKGRKLIIDWTRQDKFRTTRFPTISDPH